MKIKLLIIGVGFMGGSLALALKRGGFEGEIFGIDINENAINKAKELGVIKDGSVDYSFIKDIEPDIVVLASPVRTFRDIAKRLSGIIKEDCLVTDLGSVKGKLVYDLEKILGKRYVGSHPIAGTEKSGVEYSRGDLFINKKIIITPTENTDKEFLKRTEDIWRFTGGIIEYMDPMLHDWVFGAVSHLPHAVAFALIDALIRMSDEIDLFKYPGAGFKDFSRIAGSDPVMWRDIFLENKENVLKAINVYIKSLEKLRELIEREEENELTEFLKEARERRLSLEREVKN